MTNQPETDWTDTGTGAGWPIPTNGLLPTLKAGDPITIDGQTYTLITDPVRGTDGALTIDAARDRRTFTIHPATQP